jgi:hypothetical protein
MEKSSDIDLHDVVQVAILEQLVRDGARSCEAAEADKRSCEEEVKASHAAVSCAVLSFMSLSSRSFSDFIGMHSFPLLVNYCITRAKRCPKNKKNSSKTSLKQQTFIN